MTTEPTNVSTPIHEYDSAELEDGRTIGIVGEIDEAFMLHTESTLALQIYAAIQDESESLLIASLLEMSLSFLSAPCNKDARSKVLNAFESNDLEIAEMNMPAYGRVALSKISRSLGYKGQRARYILQMWSKKLEEVRIDKKTTSRTERQSESRDADDETNPNPRQSETEI